MNNAAAHASASERFDRSIRSNWPTALVVVLALAVFAWAYSRGVLGLPQIAAMAIGGGVGCVEIMGRYRHAPVRAAFSWSGYVYILVNVLASWMAFYLLGVFDAFPVAKDATQDLVDRRTVELALAAGFGALVVLRSSLFKVRVGDTDVGIGPPAVLDTLLLIADRGVDRREAVSRAQDVSALVAHVKDYRIIANMLTKYSLALMQNVDERTSKELGEAIGKILSDPDIPDAIKMDIVALRLGVVVGPDVLEAAVDALGDRLSVAPQPVSSMPPPAPAPAPPTAAALKAEIEAGRPSAGRAGANTTDPPAR
jgi:hypothetical protein